MILSRMRFKGYSWEHNPKALKLTSTEQLSEQVVPQGKFRIQDFGARSRVVSGTAQLYGDDCLQQYHLLQKLQNQSTSGVLSVPDMQPFYAYFKSIELACDPTPDLVTYNFEFIEDLTKKAENNDKVYHIVKEDETMWDISYAYDVDIQQLVELNTHIKRLDELEEGESIRIC